MEWYIFFVLGFMLGGWFRHIIPLILKDKGEL